MNKNTTFWFVLSGVVQEVTYLEDDDDWDSFGRVILLPSGKTLAVSDSHLYETKEAAVSNAKVWLERELLLVLAREILLRERLAIL